jgi:Tfp pilus assembly protein PilX
MRLVIAVMVLAVMISQAAPSRLAESELQRELADQRAETRSHIGE